MNRRPTAGVELGFLAATFAVAVLFVVIGKAFGFWGIIGFGLPLIALELWAARRVARREGRSLWRSDPRSRRPQAGRLLLAIVVAFVLLLPFGAAFLLLRETLGDFAALAVGFVLSVPYGWLVAKASGER